MRIVGVEVPDAKRIEAALTYIYGIGWHNVSQILAQAQVDPNKRAKDLSQEEVTRLIKALGQIPTEGELRQEIRENIQRLKSIGSYRGKRHQLGLPVRGQQTRTNARTKRGKRKTIGARRRDDRAKMGATKAKKD